MHEVDWLWLLPNWICSKICIVVVHSIKKIEARVVCLGISVDLGRFLIQ